MLLTSIRGSLTEDPDQAAHLRVLSSEASAPAPGPAMWAATEPGARVKWQVDLQTGAAAPGTSERRARSPLRRRPPAPRR
jgi:hypothetical protein